MPFRRARVGESDAEEEGVEEEGAEETGDEDMDGGWMVRL
jgi:hypothetical protein